MAEPTVQEQTFIPSENSESFIPDEDIVVLPPLSNSFVKQGALLVNQSTDFNSVPEEKITELSLLQKKTEAQLRQNATLSSFNKASQEFNNILQTTENNENTSEIIANNLNLLAQKQFQNRTALEKEVADVLQISSMTNPINKYLLDNDSTTLSRANKKAQKELLIGNKIQSLIDKSDMGDSALDLLSEVTLVSFLQRSFGFGIIDYADELRSMQTAIEQEDDPEKVAALLDENEKMIKSTQLLGSNPRYVANMMQDALTSSRTEQLGSAYLNALDFVDTFLTVGSIFKLSKTISKTSTLTEASTTVGATDAIVKDIVNGSEVIVSDTVEKFSLASGLRTEFDSADAVSAAVRKEYEVNQRVLNMVLDNPMGVTYDDVASLNVIDGIRDRLKAEFSNGSITSVVMKADGTSDVLMLKAGAKGYKSESTARSAIKLRKLQKAIPEELPSGTWGIKVNVPTIDANIADASTSGITAATRFLRRPEAWVDSDLLVYGQMSEQSINQISKAGIDVFEKSIGKLNAKEESRVTIMLEAGIELGQQQNRWMTPKEIDIAYRKQFDGPPSDKEMNALAGYRLLNDFQYHLDNRVIYQKQKSEGFGSVNADVFGSEVSGKFITDIPKFNHVFDKDSGEVLLKSDLPDGYMQTHDIIETTSQGYSTLAGKAENGALKENPTSYIAVPKGSVEIDALNYNQLSYLAGGRVRYDAANTFLKQVNTGNFQKGGGSYRLPDKTLFMASSFPQAKRISEQMNAINALIRKGIDDPLVKAKVDNLIEKNQPLGVDTIEEYLEKVEARGMDISKDITPLRNREVIREDGLPEQVMDDVQFQSAANGRLSQRGMETVPHVNPDSSKSLNPLQALNQNFAATSQNAAFTAYKDYALSYMERYRKYLNVPPNSPRIELLTAGIKGGTSLDKKQVNRILGEQRFAKEVIGKRSEEQIASHISNEKMIEWALGTKLGSKLLGKAGKDEKLGQYSQSFSGDPIGKLRGLVFNMKLGLFSLPAALIQAAHAPIIMAMAPRHGFKALVTYPLLRVALISRDPDVIKEIAKSAGKLDLKGYGDLEKFFKGFRNQGYDNFGANQVYEDAAIGDTLLQGWGSRFSRKGRMFFEEGELVPRLTAYSTAVREWVANANKINPKGLDIDTKDAEKYITQRTSTLTLGMTRADLQQGLKGGFSGLMFQFQSYPMRAVDAMFFPSKGLTSGEKARMAAGYLIMFGSAGLPLASSFVDYAANKFDADRELSDTTYKMLYNGIVDGSAMAAFGEDTNFSSRGALGTWVKDIIKTFTDPNQSVLETLAGPVGSTGSGAVDTMVQYAKVWNAGYNPDPSQITGSVVMDMVKQVSSFNNLYRTWIAYNTGKIYDSRGNQFKDVTLAGSLLQLFGLPPQAYEDMGTLFYQKEMNKEIKKLAKEHLVKLHLEFARTQDPDIQNQINAVASYAQMDGILESVNTSVITELSQGSLYERTIEQAKLDYVKGTGKLPIKLEVQND